jgi:hypothetical protein
MSNDDIESLKEALVGDDFKAAILAWLDSVPDAVEALSTQGVTLPDGDIEFTIKSSIQGGKSKPGSTEVCTTYYVVIHGIKVARTRCTKKS